MFKKWWEKRKRASKEADEILKKLADAIAEEYDREAEKIMRSLSNTATEEEVSL